MLADLIHFFNMGQEMTDKIEDFVDYSLDCKW